jgi:pimeloyl-ACP methyl ester carboxylesterase
VVAGIREQALVLGARKSLVGVIAQGPTNNPANPAVVILNSGIIHRVGPNRIFVRLARVLAAQGYVVLRFDLSGIGDSEPRADGLEPLAAALTDIREVLDSLESTRQIRRVILVGLCSGADHSVIYGGQDERVAGVVLIDPSVPRTPGYYFRHYRRRVFRWQSWRNFVLARHPLWKALGRSVRRPARIVEDDPQLQPWPDLRSPEVRNFLCEAYARAVSAGVQIMAIFTGGREDQHNDPRQLFEAFPKVRFGSQLRLEFLGSADHTFSFESDRGRLLQIIMEWTTAQARALVQIAEEQPDALPTR